jgi:hypothetical protein
MDKIQSEMKGHIEYFLYADDLMVIGKSIKCLKEFDSLIIKWTKKYKLIINSNKTETQYITRRRENVLIKKEKSL